MKKETIQPQDNKELFAGGELEATYYHDCLYLLGTNGGTICELQFYDKNDARALAPVLAQAPAMYKALDKCLAFYEDSDYPERAEEIKSILNKANPKP